MADVTPELFNSFVLIPNLPGNIPTTSDRRGKGRRASPEKKRCKICGEIGHYATAHKNIDAVPDRKCSRCKKIQPKENFSVLRAIKFSDGNVRIRRTSICNSCEAIRSVAREDGLTIDEKLKRLVRAARRRDEEHGLKSEITIEFLRELYAKQGGRCFYTGGHMVAVRGHEAPSLDRKDSSKGYTKENVVLCRAIVNWMKNTLTVEAFVALCREVTKHFEG